MALTKEDLEYRKNKIGASDAPIILGISKWKTPLQLWEEKLGLRSLPETNSAMQRGNDLEPVALAEFMRMTNTVVAPCRVEHPEFSFMFATVDGLCAESKILVEIKCPNRETVEMAKNGLLPDQYYAQVQHQIACVNPVETHYFCFDGEKGYDVIVKRDDALIDKIVKAEKEFFRCMMEFTPPPATDRDFIHRDSKEWRLHAEVWKDTKKQLALLVAKEEVLRDELIKMCDGQSSQGCGVRISKTVSKGRINYSAIDELKEIDLEKYRGKPITLFRFTEMKDKNE